MFLALDAHQTAAQQPDEYEDIEVVIMPFAQAVSHAWDGTLRQDDSALALLLADKKLQKFARQNGA